MKNKLLIFALSALSAVICGCSTLIPDESYDVVVYGGTSAGVTSAVQAAKSGKKVVLIAPEGRLGAMSSSGLGMTDSGKTATIGGLSREFYHRIWKEYQKPETWKWQKRENFKARGQGTKAIDDEHKVMWIFEPSVAADPVNDAERHDNAVDVDHHVKDDKPQHRHGEHQNDKGCQALAKGLGHPVF